VVGRDVGDAAGGAQAGGVVTPLLQFIVDTIWVARLNISPRTAHKISSVHGLQADEVRAAVERVPGLPFTWNDHPERGRRAIVRAVIRDRPVLVVLYPTHDPFGEVWNLGSAYPL
jgi:hypothetical protein